MKAAKYAIVSLLCVTINQFIRPGMQLYRHWTGHQGRMQPPLTINLVKEDNGCPQILSELK